MQKFSPGKVPRRHYGLAKAITSEITESEIISLHWSSEVEIIAGNSRYLAIKYTSHEKKEICFWFDECNKVNVSKAPASGHVLY